MYDNCPIHILYQPLQPFNNSNSDKRMFYERYHPSDALKPYIYYYWVYKSNSREVYPFTASSIPDGCIDVFIDCTDFSGLNLSGVIDRTDISTGNVSGKFEYFGINFFPGTFFSFFPHPQNELKNMVIPLKDLTGKVIHDFECLLFEAESTYERVNISESFLKKQLLNKPVSEDNRLIRIINNIYETKGQYLIENNSDTGISARQLRRIFNRQIGLNPKKFVNIVRFQSLIFEIINKPSDEWKSVYYDYGYYDQAHFINEFKNYFGEPPMSSFLIE